VIKTKQNIDVDESAGMGTSLQQKKKLLAGEWDPFKRADPKLLKKLHTQLLKKPTQQVNYEDAPF
jgi:hypothetical protein